MQETDRIELKRELTPDVDIEREVIAFLNATGGTIYIGIEDAGNVVGIENSDDCMLCLKDRIKNNIQPSAMGLFDISVEHIEGKNVVKLLVAGGLEKPYYKTKYGLTSKGVFIRVGTAAEPMPQPQIDRLFATRTRHSLGKMLASRQDLTFEQLRIYYEEHGKRLNDNFRRTLELQTEDGRYNYVAYLLADENGNSMKVAKYASLDRCDLIENNEYGYCSLIKATKSILQKLDIENLTAARITPVERKETSLWDKVALREAVINAIVHNDYSFEVPPKFEIFPDRLEITSMGSLPEGMTQEEFFSGVSIPRNKELMRIYRDVGLVESLGSGVPRILQTYGKGSFHFTEVFTRITFPIAQETLDLLSEYGVSSPTDTPNLSEEDSPMSEKMSGETASMSEKMSEEVTNMSEKILRFIQTNPDVSAKDMADALGVTARTIERHLSKLKTAGTICHKGPNKGGHWEIGTTFEKGQKH